MKRKHQYEAWQLLIPVVLLGGFATGCSSIPTAELQAYTAAFDEARDAGEAMLTDHVVARHEFARVPQAATGFDFIAIQEVLIKQGRDPESITALRDQIAAAQVPAEIAEGSSAYLSALTLDVLGTTRPSASDAAIAYRRQAWDVIARYNELLIALAAGRSGAEMETAVNGFFNSVQQLPTTFSGLANLAADLAPYGQPIAFFLNVIESEINKGRFRDAVLAAEPLIDGLIANVLITDAQDFYDIRLALYIMSLTPDVFGVAETAGSFRALATPHHTDPEVAALVTEINEAWQRLPTYNPDENTITLPTGGTATAPSAEKFAQLQDLRTSILNRVDAVMEHQARFNSYRAAARAYGALLDEFQRANQSVGSAVAHSTKTLPAVGQFEAVISSARQAIEIYRTTR